MQIIHVIPFAKGLGRETLSYFSAEPIVLGSIVTVPINKRAVSGMVVSCESAEHLKSEIKSASFELKKLSSTKSAPFFLTEFIEAAKRSGTYFAATTGAVDTPVDRTGKRSRRGPALVVMPRNGSARPAASAVRDWRSWRARSESFCASPEVVTTAPSVRTDNRRVMFSAG